MQEIISSKYGELKPSTHRSYWSGGLKLGNHEIQVIADFEDSANVPKNLPEKFERFFAALPKIDGRFREAAAKNLLELFNGTWSDEDNPPISAEEFARRIKLDGVNFSEGDDAVEIYYDDDNLFAGHQIKVVASYDGTVKSADLP